MKITFDLMIEDRIIAEKAREMVGKEKGVEVQEFPLEIFENSVEDVKTSMKNFVQNDEMMTRMNRVFGVYAAAMIAANFLVPENHEAQHGVAVELFKEEMYR